MLSSSNKNTLLVGLIGALFFLPFLGGVHLFDWDEINFAEIAREMVILGEYLRTYINFETFTEKPPMFFWMQALSMHLFGINEYAARFPNAICGIITLMTLYKIGEKFYNARFGFIWAGAYFGTVLSHLYFKSGIIDPWFNFFIFLGLYHLILFYWKKESFEGIELPKNKYYYLIIAGVFTGLGILVKGPVAYLITGLTLGVYWVMKRFRFYINPIEFIIYTISALAVTATWFGVETLVRGPQFVIEFTIRQWTIFSTPDAGHAGFPGYHFVVILIGCFPTSILFLRSFKNLDLKQEFEKDFKKWMMVLFWVVLILFTIVKSKIVHYSSMTYFPLTYLAALVVERIISGQIQLNKWMKFGLLSISILTGTLVILLPWAGMNTDIIKPLFSQDKFALHNLNADVSWTGIESIAGILLIGVTVASIILINRGKAIRGFQVLFGGIGVFVFSTLILFIAKIEKISQNAAITFYESKQNCNCYVVPEKFKSYGQLFYKRPMPEERPESKKMEWLKYGDIDKDVYFVAKITGTEELEQMKDVTFLEEKNGFTFWLRKAKK